MFKLSFLSPVLRQYTVVLIANLSIACLGMSLVWGSPMLIKLRDETQGILTRLPTEEEEAWIMSISLLVGLTAIGFTGFFMNNFGRKKTILISYIPRILACLLKIFATDVWMLLLARSFAGIADLLSLSAISTYTSEIASKQIRGASGTMTQINSAMGMLIMFGVGPFVSYLTINIMMSVVVLGAFIPLLFMPESPYFFYLKGDTKKSIEVLTFLHGTEELAQTEFKEYSTSNTDKDVDLKTLLRDRIVLKTMGIAFILPLGVQLSGYNAVNFYLQSIFESTQTTASPEISSLIIGVIQLVACLCTFLLTDRFGRKPILCTTLAGMGIGMIGLASFFTLLENNNNMTGFFNYLPLISVGFVIYGFNAGMGSLIWILIAEVLDGPVRPYGITLGVATGFSSAFLLTLLFPAIISAIGAAIVYWIFAAGCGIVVVFIAFVVPETKGKTFAEIQTDLGRRDSKEIFIKV